MTAEERRAAACRVLILLEPEDAHDEKCPAHKDPATCTCHLIRNTRVRVAALDDAGLLCALAEAS